MKTLLGLALMLVLYSGLNGQPQFFWRDTPVSLMRNADQRRYFPDRYRSCAANADALRTFLMDAPAENDGTPLVNGLTLAVPDPDGRWDTFALVRYEMMEAGLAARYPGFGTYRGVSVSGPDKTIRCDWTAKGFSAIINTPTGRYHIEPFARNNQDDYLVFYKRDYPDPKTPFSCGAEFVPADESPGMRVSGDCIFRSYRLAVATTGEYSNYFGATSSADEAIVLSEVVMAVNRLNEVYERDVTVRLVLIANTTSVFYYDPGSDPFSGGACSQLSQNQTNMTNVIGGANYDIGHVFGVGSGGCASAGVCSSNNKARGATGTNPPNGDLFYIDYVAHEIGHQFGASHTFNNSCNNNISPSNAYEPGSGSTIMAYAGICNPNVQSNSDDYFHGRSVSQINTWNTTGTGNTCDVPLTFNNNAPVVTPGSDYTIPKSTPFMLTATASDPDGDPLTYCWEQWDNEIGTMPPSPTNTVGPMFRSLDPSSSPTRYFPNLDDLVNNITPTWEVLSSVTRDMEFRLTVRDFHNALAGCTDEDNVIIHTTSAAGPFVLTYPNTGAVEWLEGATETVTWNVANTTASPVSCANVDLLLSYDGGLTYPETLASGVPNDGAHDIVVPVGTTTSARVMVKGAGNVFFDISNANFGILPGAPTYALSITPDPGSTCIPGSVDYTIDVLSVQGYTDPVLLGATGLPPGAIPVFTPQQVIPGNTAILTIEIPAGTPASESDFFVQGSSTAGLQEVGTTLIAGLQMVTPLTPADQAVNVPVAVPFAWVDNPGAPDYTIQISADGFFSEIVVEHTTTAASWTSPGLDAARVYYWRMRATNACGTSGWSEVRAFRTANCILAESTDVPKTIPSNGMPTVTSQLTLSGSGTISDLQVIDLAGTHSYLNDLQFTLRSPQNTEVILIDRWCGDEDNFDINLDDDAPPGAAPCPYNDGLTYQPQQPLSALNGESFAGSWTLIVKDFANQDGGSLNSWGIEVCLSGGCTPIVSNPQDSGLGSLRDALSCAQPGDTIVFASAMHGQSIVLNSPLVLTSGIYIKATPADEITISGASTDRTIEISPGIRVTIEGLTILPGSAPSGSAIQNMGRLTLRDVRVQQGIPPSVDLVLNHAFLTLLGHCQIAE